MRSVMFFGRGVEMQSNDVMQAIFKKIVEKFEDLGVNIPDDFSLS